MTASLNRTARWVMAAHRRGRLHGMCMALSAGACAVSMVVELAGGACGWVGGTEALAAPRHSTSIGSALHKCPASALDRWLVAQPALHHVPQGHAALGDVGVHKCVGCKHYGLVCDHLKRPFLSTAASTSACTCRSEPRQTRTGGGSDRKGGRERGRGQGRSGR